MIHLYVSCSRVQESPGAGDPTMPPDRHQSKTKPPATSKISHVAEFHLNVQRHAMKD